MHFVGSGFSITPGHHSGGKGEYGGGSSLVVVQFVELIRGERVVGRPANRVRVAELVMDELYCLGCYGVRNHDVARDIGNQVVWRRCRCCGKEGG